MTGRRPFDNLARSRRLLTKRREVELTRFGRRRLWRNLFSAVFGIGLVLAAWYLYRALRNPKDEPGLPKTYPVVVQCTECGFREVRQVRYGERFPLICAKCGLKSLRRVWRCQSCGAEFLPPPIVTGPVTCPSCGSTAVGGVPPP